MLETCARWNRTGRLHGIDAIALAKIDTERLGRLRAACRRRRQPHHGHDHDGLDRHGDEALPEKDRVAEWNDAAWHETARRYDLANLRLKRTGRRHLQRSRSAQALRPDAAET